VTELAFELPPALEATAPPEARGLPRDGVSLMVARRSTGEIRHHRFSELETILAPGDLLVVNVSATLPAAVPGRRRDGSEVRVHFATPVPDLGARWRVVELRSADGSRPARGRAGETISLGAAGQAAPLELVAPYASGTRLLLARLDGARTVAELLEDEGEPIRYGYVERRWPLAAYQNVYATTPGSAEMPSAGRPFTADLITALLARGVAIAPITLHTGVSSPERHESPFPEPYEVPAATARLVELTRASGGRVIAVGTTVVRALETVAKAEPRMARVARVGGTARVARPEGTARGGAGWTSLVIAPDSDIHAVDGMITGWHEPEASHLDMLTAVGGHELLERSYDEALRCGYLWHEFGDSHLILAS
jgi:S-adenosylmethionine:tRNA ribosyltransferase-isomerase